MSEDTKEVMHERLKLAAENYSTAHLGGDHVTMADIGYAHGHVFQLALDYIAELERALAAAETREREAYERAAKVCDKVYDEAAGWLKEHPTTHEYGEAMADGVCEGAQDCAIAIRALAKEREA